MINKDELYAKIREMANQSVKDIVEYIIKTEGAKELIPLNDVISIVTAAVIRIIGEQTAMCEFPEELRFAMLGSMRIDIMEAVDKEIQAQINPVSRPMQVSQTLQ